MAYTLAHAGPSKNEYYCVYQVSRPIQLFVLALLRLISPGWIQCANHTGTCMQAMSAIDEQFLFRQV